jgi:hypothetical protein
MRARRAPMCHFRPLAGKPFIASLLRADKWGGHLSLSSTSGGDFEPRLGKSANRCHIGTADVEFCDGISALGARLRPDHCDFLSIDDHARP